MVTAQTWHLMKLHQHYKNGTLLHGGGIYEQPHYYMRAMEIIDNALKH